MVLPGEQLHRDKEITMGYIDKTSERHKVSELALLLEPAVVKAKFNITDEELAVLNDFGQKYSGDVNVFINDFYEWMQKLAEFNEFFKNSAIVERVKTQQIKYWHEFLSGQITPVYLKNRIHIGAIHAEIGLPIHSYCAAMNYSSEWWKERIEEYRNNYLKNEKNKTTRVIDLASAFNKLIQLDITIVTETYHQNTQKRLQQTLEETQDIVHNITKIAEAVVEGDYSAQLNGNSSLDIAINKMIYALNSSAKESARDTWIKTGQAQLGEKLRGDQDLPSLCSNAIEFIAKYLNAKVGVFYLLENNDHLVLMGSYAYQHRKNLSNEFEIGQGLLGQAVLEKQPMIVDNLPDSYLAISSGLGEAKAPSVLVNPIIMDGKVTAVIELGTFGRFEETHLELLKVANDTIAISLESARNRRRMNELLQDSQKKSRELEVQSKNLEIINKELEDKANKIKASEDKLKSQSEILQATNEKLEEKTQALEMQKCDMQRQNERLEKSQKLLREKASELEKSSKYKSEFLSNMSHELRTPLNSLLILSQVLMGNEQGNLTDDQIETAKIIYSSGKDLLNLINDILDLSKVEAGKLQIELTTFSPKELAKELYQRMKPIAKHNKINFKVLVEKNVPESAVSDTMRIDQVLKNLVANALKFTDENGDVILKVFRADKTRAYLNEPLQNNEVYAFSVIDTGIGISEEDKSVIFEAFKQADGTTSRKYAGTGLGLTISRQLATLLGGEIQLESEVGKGTTITLYLPLKGPDKVEITNPKDRSKVPEEKQTIIENKSAYTNQDIIQNESSDIKGKKILLVDDDMRNNIALGSYLRKHNFEIITADNGELALQCLSEDKTIDLVLMDIMMPIMDGYTTMQHIRNRKEYQDLPIIALTAKTMAEDKEKCIQAGANDYLTKPLDTDKLFNVMHVWLNKNP